MRVDQAEHLPKEKRIELGGFYTPENLVRRVYDFTQSFLKSVRRETVIFDNAGGCGAFLVGINGYDYRVADRDPEACKFLRTHFDRKKVFCSNSLIGVNRNKYGIAPNVFLVVVGNPPYNDTTSEFRSGQKGEHLCDDKLRDRDLGISFLKSYNELTADLVCVLHPLSYLIKEANFRRLQGFRENYRLVKGEIFSSAAFQGTGSSKFPVLVALYERDSKGMTYDYIRKFRFDVLDSDQSFVLAAYSTTDGYINKYPPRKEDPKKSPIGLYYYTFRDLNSLKKNTSFMTSEHRNGIVVTLENFYKYSYLYALKLLFTPTNSWLYGNLSPLVDMDALERDRALYAAYALRTSRVFESIGTPTRRKIEDFYDLRIDRMGDVGQLEQAIKNKLSQLV